MRDIARRGGFLHLTHAVWDQYDNKFRGGDRQIWLAIDKIVSVEAMCGYTRIFVAGEPNQVSVIEPADDIIDAIHWDRSEAIKLAADKAWRGSGPDGGTAAP